MSGSAKEAPKKMPKGGRKGGAVFPRMSLEQAVNYAKRLVSKTHTGPQPEDVIYVGVLDNKGATGKVRLSAIKQFGFVIGDTKEGFEASPAAKALAAATPEELPENYKQAAIRPKIFKQIFDTYHGDNVSRAKIKQRAMQLNVHADLAEDCVENYVATFSFAGLVTIAGDDIKHVPAAAPANAPSENETAASREDQNGSDAVSAETQKIDPVTELPPAVKPSGGVNLPATAVFHVNITLDSSLDTEKLSKQLELLKRYGAI